MTSSWFFLSDLHLDDRPGPGTGPRSPCPGSWTLAGTDGPTHLVLLGDTFELASAPGDPVPRLDRIARRHPAVVLALRRCLAAGVQVHVVAGNHDLELVRAGEQARLTRLLGSVDLHVHPWCLYEPGLFYAEHGHQHHDLTRYPRMVAAGEHPPTPLAAWADGAQGPLPVLRALSAATSEERRSRRPDHREALHEVAARAGLPAGSAPALHEVSPLSTWTGHRATGPSGGGPGRGRDDRDGYLRRAAVRIDEASADCKPRRTTSSGTHTPVVRGLPHTQSLYANPGTWTSVPAGSGLPYVLPTHDQRGATLRLMRRVAEVA